VSLETAVNWYSDDALLPPDVVRNALEDTLKRLRVLESAVSELRAEEVAARDKEIERLRAVLHRQDGDLAMMRDERDDARRRTTHAPSGHWTREPVPEKWQVRYFWWRHSDGETEPYAGLSYIGVTLDRWSTPIPLPGEERSEVSPQARSVEQ